VALDGQAPADVLAGAESEDDQRLVAVVELPTGHCPNWSAPQDVAELLLAIAEQKGGPEPPC
jgi:hypothetical protein